MSTPFELAHISHRHLLFEEPILIVAYATLNFLSLSALFSMDLMTA